MITLEDVINNEEVQAFVNASQKQLKALGYTEDNEWMAMQDLSKYCQDAIPIQLKELQDLDVLHDRVIDVASMKDVVCESTKEVFHD